MARITSSTACIQLILDLHRRLQCVEPQGHIALRPFVLIGLTILIATINAWLVYDDFSRLRLQSQRRSRRLSRHLQRMVITLIAVLTVVFIVELSARFFERGHHLWPLDRGPDLTRSPLFIIFSRRVASLPNTPERL